MLAFFVTTTTAHVLAVVGLACIVVFLVSRVTASPTQRMMRGARLHAERTTRAMRRMTRIKEQTIRRMDEAERKGRR